MPSLLLQSLPGIVTGIAVLTSIFGAFLTWQLKNLSDPKALTQALSKERRNDLKDLYVKINAQFAIFLHAGMEGRAIEPSTLWRYTAHAMRSRS